MLILHFISQKKKKIGCAFAQNQVSLLEPFRLKLCQPKRGAEGFVGEHRAEMTAPCNVLGTDFRLRKHLIPGRHALISIQVLGEAGRRAG